MSEPYDLVILGCGYAGRAIAARGRQDGQRVCGTVRSAARADALRAAGFDVVREDALQAHVVEPLISPTTHVVIAFPPDGTTEHDILPALSRAAAITFISTTGVYGDRTGRIDDATPVPPPTSPSASAFLAAESLFRSMGATTLRCPGIYGPDRGLHVRVVSGLHKLAGDGSRATSRIHIVDLAAFALASRRLRGETFVVGDLAPCPQLEIVTWIAQTYGVVMPPSVPLEQVPASLRGDRRADPSRALAVLGVELTHPTYRTGMHPDETGLSAAASRGGPSPP